ncbi:hypothetical protein VB773_08925 [Haloarculaceae archaeon H-GB2-1]|nr:hypothetical protein [Haloarculaceae archaeon H-GB1-1]MEA5386173.1 hypothetical protein [Haloarculaceae archaeon H-GB11]MEA5407678.1 hypothetical protein [Haloarculaceae archaeon H-GB2-1]
MPDGSQTFSSTELFALCKNPYRRALLERLDERAEPTTVGEVARAIDSRMASTGQETTGSASIESTLRHVHLPQVAAAELVSWDGDSVRLTDAGRRAANQLRQLVETRPDGYSWEALFDALADPVRQSVLETLVAERTPISQTALATAVDSDARSGADSDPERLLVRLHHVHLPKLEAADLVSYDRDERTVDLATDDEDASWASSVCDVISTDEIAFASP